MNRAAGPGEAASSGVGGDAGSTRDAEVASFVRALRAAATPSKDLAAHGRKILELERFVAGTARHRRVHVATLLEAPLEAETRDRVRVGLPPREDRLFRGWVSLPTGGDEPAMDGGAGTGGSASPRPAEDVHTALRRSTVIARDLLVVEGGSDEAARMWDEMEDLAFAPCHGTPASMDGGRDRRRPLIFSWLVLRHRRPLAAAVPRRCLTLDRRWRRGHV